MTNDKLRYEIILDGKAVATPNIHAKDFSGEWSNNVIRSQAVGLFTADGLAAGEHTLSIKPIDEEVLLDTIEITQPKSR